MAVTLSSDIVAGVLRAAPDASRADAANRLAGRAGSPSGEARFASAVDELSARTGLGAQIGVAARTPEERGLAGSGGGMVVSHADESPAALKKREIKAFVGLEAVLARTMFESMLPEAGTGVFGSGLAGSLWRSQAAEHYATLFASSGGFGLVDELGSYAGGQESSQAMPGV